MKFLKDQRGIAHIVEIIIIAVIILGVGGFIAWRMLSTQPSNDSAANSQLQQAIANAKCEYDDKDLCKFMSSYKINVDYKVVSTLVSGDSTTTMTMESADQGKRTHQTSSFNGKPYETIVIGDVTYTKDFNDGKWWKQTKTTAQTDPAPPVTEDFAPDFTDPNELNNEGVKVEYKKIGTEACGDKTCFKYQIVDPSVTDQTQYLWFDNQDYQLRRMLTTAPDSSSDFSFSYENVTITEPSPTKDLPEGAYLNPFTGEVVNYSQLTQ